MRIVRVIKGIETGIHIHLPTEIETVSVTIALGNLMFIIAFI